MFAQDDLMERLVSVDVSFIETPIRRSLGHSWKLCGQGKFANCHVLSQKRSKRAAADRNKLAELLYLTSRIKALNAVSRRICKQYRRIASGDNFCRLKIEPEQPIVQPVVVNHCQTFDRRGLFVNGSFPDRWADLLLTIDRLLFHKPFLFHSLYTYRTSTTTFCAH